MSFLRSIRFITLVYQSPDVTVVLAFGREEEIGRTALRLLKPYLPSKFFSHFSSNFASELSNSFKAESHGLYMKMSIENLQQAKENAEKLHEQNPSVRLSSEDIESVNAFYKEAYPENWFDPRMLQTGQFFGIWDECSSPRRLTVIAGVHVFSPEYNVVALGNIATHPSYRRQGRARLAIAALVKSSIEAGISQIGLNVKADNTAAIEMYRRLGFVEIDYYEENMFYKIE
jgi:ribosomal protein S18 acetylase RimI-like enzyme